MNTQEWPGFVRLSRQRWSLSVRACARMLVPLVLMALAFAGTGCTVIVRMPKSVDSAQAAQMPSESAMPAAVVVTVPPTETPTVAPTPTAAPVTRTKAPKATAKPTLAPTPVPSSTATPTPAPLSYVVQPGDSVYKIAAHYGISPHILADYNRLTNPSYLQVGQVLLIPQGGPQSVDALDGNMTSAGATPEALPPGGAPPDAPQGDAPPGATPTL
jgi:LysM repeat protein